MAVIPATVTRLENGYTKVTWIELTDTDTGDPVNVAQFADKTVQATGTFTGGGLIAMQGSNDGSTFGDLRDAGGTDIALADTQPNTIAENTELIRPSVTAGDGSTDIDVFMICQGER